MQFSPSFTRNFAGLAIACGAFTSAHAATLSFQVQAQANSLATQLNDAVPPAQALATDLFFSPGDSLAVTAAGTWDGGCGTLFGPDGAQPGSNGCGGGEIEPVTGLTLFSLVGRVGAGSWFTVGSSYNQVVTGSGQLFLGFLDTDSANNRGSVTARVTGGNVPEPGTLALVLASAAAMVVARRAAASRATNAA